MSKTVYVLVGLPGSGKSQWLKDRRIAPISSDALRIILVDDETHQGIHRQVFRTVRFLLHERLKLGRPETYVDATNLTVKDRRPYIVIGHMYNARVVAIWFDVPIEVCKERNRGRTRVVPEQAIDLLAGRFVVPTIKEGFDAVQRVCGPPRVSAAPLPTGGWV